MMSGGTRAAPGMRTAGEIEASLLTGGPRRRFIVDGVLPSGPSIWYGPSGSGKTGLAIATAIAVAAGMPWSGVPVRGGAVLYVAGEDLHGVYERVIAAIQAAGLEADRLAMAVVEAPEGGVSAGGSAGKIGAVLSDLVHRFDVAPALVVVDTLAACFGPENQDDARPASSFMNEIDLLARSCECAVLVVHHTGKYGSSMRGSQVFYDRADSVAIVKGGRDRSFVNFQKMRSARQPPSFSFAIGAIDIPIADGSLCVQVVRDIRPEAREPDADETGRRARPPADWQVALRILGEIASDNKATLADWKTACFSEWSEKATDGTRSTALSNAKKTLENKGLIKIRREIVSIVVSKETANANANSGQSVSVSVSPPLYRGGAANTLMPQADDLRPPVLNRRRVS